MKPRYEIFSYYINNIITKETVSLAIDCFYLEKLASQDKKTKFAILFKVVREDGHLIDISALQIVDSTQMDSLKIIFNEFLSCFPKIKGKKIILTYSFIFPPLAPIDYVYNSPVTNYINLNNLASYCDKLPNNRLFQTWGDYFTMHNDINFSVERPLTKFIIWQIDNEYHISWHTFGDIMCYFKDIYDPNCISDNTFIRIIGDAKLYYHYGNYYLINPRDLINKNNFIK